MDRSLLPSTAPPQEESKHGIQETEEQSVTTIMSSFLCSGYLFLHKILNFFLCLSKPWVSFFLSFFRFITAVQQELFLEEAIIGCYFIEERKDNKEKEMQKVVQIKIEILILC